MSGLKPVSFKKGRAHAPRLSEPYVPGRRHERFWTEAEDDILRRHYETGGLSACQAHLPHRARASIYNHAHKLGLQRQGLPAVRQKHEASPELDERIRAEWAQLHGRGAVNDLANRLGVPRWWLSDRARRLGLTIPHRKEPAWTDAENDLMRKVPLHDPDRCAEIFRQHGFRRTPTAIVVRAKRLDLSRRATRETLSARQAAAILGIDDKTVTALCIAGELAATRRADRRLPQQGGNAWEIKRADLRQYIVEHLERIDLRKVEKFAFVQLLTGDRS
ncbi:MAG TPA: helix-turn-helix domain-containing protein [Xanthobacteraceae bacterium]|nr:helix-turn-helix domain-containing protein [Xanthobacteraceae bacterium]